MTDSKKGDGLTSAAFPGDWLAPSQPDDEGLEALFAEARDADPVLPDFLMSRILADADQVLQDQEAAQQAARPVAPRPAIWRRLMGIIGGGPGLAGLAAATMAGVWIGVVPPAAVQTGLQAVLGTDGTEDFFDIYFVDTTNVFDFAQTEG